MIIMINYSWSVRIKYNQTNDLEIYVLIVSLYLCQFATNTQKSNDVDTNDIHLI